MFVLEVTPNRKPLKYRCLIIEYARKGGTYPFAKIYIFSLLYFSHEELLLLHLLLYKNKSRHQMNLDIIKLYTCSYICGFYNTNEKSQPQMQSVYLVGNNKFCCIYIVLNENYTLRATVLVLITLLLNVCIMKIFTICFKSPSLNILQFACINNTNITFQSCIITFGQNTCTL